MKILVTGGLGFIGKQLVQRLMKENQVIVIDKNTEKDKFKDKFMESNLLMYNLDLSQSPPLEFLRDIDYVFHLATAKDSAGEKVCYLTNVEGTINLLHWLAELSPNLKKFIYIGSLLSYGFGEKKKASSLYGKTKLLAEREIRRFGDRIPYIILRSCRVYGPGDKRGIYLIFKFIKKGFIPVVSKVEERFASLIYIDDIIEAMILAAQSNITNKVYSISDGNVYSWKEVYEAMALALDKEYKKLYKITIPQKLIIKVLPLLRNISKLLGASLEGQSLEELSSKYWTCDPSDFFEDTGFKPKIFLREGMQRTGEWLKNQDLL